MSASPGGVRRELAGWGGTSASAADVVRPLTESEMVAAIDRAPSRGTVARGLGRSYGDAAQNAGGVVIDTTARAGVVSFDETTGLLTVEAGADLDSIMRSLVPRGWFVPVTPGTRHVTVGGAVAADIHGKNHHRAGTWCTHVDQMRLATPADGVVTTSPRDDAELFWATAGGMGLTGVILDVTVRLVRIPTSKVLVETLRTDTLDECMEALAAGDDDSEYSVAWVDLLPLRGQVGRAVITRGRFAEVDELAAAHRRHPLDFAPDALATVPPLPVGVVAKWNARAFNELWWRKAPRSRRDVQSLSAFFHPLDAVERWNRLYGPQGFLQWQVVVPFGAEPVLHQIAEAFAASGTPTLIGVLKRFGAANPGPLSFPLPGWTLSLDIPATADVGSLLDRLDRQVAEAGGRVYLAKDSRMRPELLDEMYPRLDEWRAVRERVDPHGVLQSDLGRRLGLC